MNWCTTAVGPAKDVIDRVGKPCLLSFSSEKRQQMCFDKKEFKEQEWMGPSQASCVNGLRLKSHQMSTNSEPYLHFSLRVKTSLL